MPRRFAWSVLVLTAACAGGPMSRSVTGTVPTPAPDAFECVRKQIKELGWTQNSYDTETLRVTAHQYDTSVRRPDVQFRRLVYRMAVQVAPETNGTGSTLAIETTTYRELTTHRGPTEVQESTADTVTAAAQALIERCGG